MSSGPKVTSALPPSLRKVSMEMGTDEMLRTQHGSLGIQTHARNKDVHPVLAAGIGPRSRRSSEQVRALEKLKQDVQEAKLAK